MDEDKQYNMLFLRFDVQVKHCGLTIENDDDNENGEVGDDFFFHNS